MCNLMSHIAQVAKRKAQKFVDLWVGTREVRLGDWVSTGGSSAGADFVSIKLEVEAAPGKSQLTSRARNVTPMLA